jgi:hypothetical protein
MTGAPDDPYGDKAWLEARQRGRGAILDQAEDWRPTKTRPPVEEDDDFGGGDAGDGEEGEAPGDREIPHDYVRMPRFFGKTTRMVAISMPDPAPITCLGRNGRTYFYLSPQGQLVELADSEHGQAHIESLWAPEINQLHRAFPQFDQQRRFKGFQAQFARAAMMATCASRPIFDAHDRVRGLGCWKDDDGRLIQHLGDEILTGGQRPGQGVKPGEVGEYVYPGRTALDRPVYEGGRAAAEAVYERFQSWNWERGDLDARLLLGQIASMVLGAALEWRPMGFITGSASTGKSTLQRLIRMLMHRRMVATVDATEAALRGMIGQDSVAVSFDEIEADSTNDRAQQVMKLARTAASGDDAHRSSASQTVRGFTLRGSFLFSAIIPPSMRQADMQRFTFFRLQKLKKGQKPPEITPAEVRALGAAMIGRITSHFERWQRTLDAFMRALEDGGHAQRGALQFGTLLAGAHILLNDRDPDASELALWADRLQRDTLFEYENTQESWMQAWQFLLSAQPEVWRADSFPTVAEVVRKYLRAHAGAAAGNTDDKKDVAKYQDKLTRAGLAVVQQRGTGRMLLAIPPRHQGVAAIYAGSDYQKAGGEGAWTQPLRGAPKIIEGNGTFDRSRNRGVLQQADKVPRLGRDQRCTLYWLDGQAEIGGVWTPIFDREINDDDDQIDAPIEREPGEEG